MLSMKEKDGTVRLYINYRLLNHITVKNEYLLPRIDGLFDQLKSSSAFSNINLISGYHQLPIKDKDMMKSALGTSYMDITSFYGPMPFSLTIALAAFMDMNSVSNDYLDEFVIVYFYLL